MWFLSAKVSFDGKEISLPIIKSRLIEKGYAVDGDRESLKFIPSSTGKWIDLLGTNLLLSGVLLSKSSSKIYLTFYYNSFAALMLWVCFGFMFYTMGKDLRSGESMLDLLIGGFIAFILLMAIVFSSISSTIKRDVKDVVRSV